MTPLAAPIVAVTVFTDRARVTRSGSTQLAPGEQTITLANLPTSLAPDSVRVAGRGAGVRILGVDVATSYITDPPEANIAELQGALEALLDRDKALQDDEAALQARQVFLDKLSDAGAGDLARGLGFGRANLEAVESLAAYLARERAAIATQRRELAQRRRELAREIEAARARLNQVRPPVPQERRAIQVAVAAEAATTLTLDVTYVVYGAFWQPIYDLRLADTTLAVSYLAGVSQQTGEDWPAVQLSLSTARPAVTTTIPELEPWYIDIFRPPPPMPRRAMAMPAAAAPMMAERMKMNEADAVLGAAADAEPPMAQIAEATIDNAGASVTYRVARPVAIPSDGTPHRTNITTLDLPARLDYVTAPKLAEEAYLRAKISNTSAFTLLPGSASIFHGDEFVGTTQLETSAPNESFELQLGIDDRIKVARELVGRNVAKTFIGNLRRTQFAYRIKLTNLLEVPTRVTVLDQLPLSRHEEIKVRLDNVQPKPSEQNELNRLTWELELRPQETFEMTFDFTVEHNRELQLIGLNV